MSREAVQQCIESAGVPCAHNAWYEGTAPDLPYATFYQQGGYGFDADNSRFVPATSWCVELYQLEADSELEARVEEAIQRDFGPFYKSETGVVDENVCETLYTFTEIG